MMGDVASVSSSPSESPPCSATNTAATIATLAESATPPELDPLHSFRRMGPELKQSIETQLKLRSAAGGEPSLWRSPFPADAYERVTELQRCIALYLFVMDLSLQRIVQSDSRYLMPDLRDNFARLRAAVADSIGQIARSIEAEADAHARWCSCLRDATSSRDDSDQAAAASLPSSPAQSVLGLQSLHASLEELDARYKRWIDMRILAQRNAIEHTHGPAQEQHGGEEEERSELEPRCTAPHPCGLAVQVAAPDEEQQPARVVGDNSGAGVSTATAVGVDGLDGSCRPLQPIPLFTPIHHARRLQLFEEQASSHSFAALPVMLSPPMRPLVRGVDVRAAVTHPPGPAAADAPRHSDPAARGVAPFSSSVSAPGLLHLDVTLTRSMDVLALNSFLFATRGSVSHANGERRGAGPMSTARLSSAQPSAVQLSSAQLSPAQLDSAFIHSC